MNTIKRGYQLRADHHRLQVKTLIDHRIDKNPIMTNMYLSHRYSYLHTDQPQSKSLHSHRQFHVQHRILKFETILAQIQMKVQVKLKQV